MLRSRLRNRCNKSRTEENNMTFKSKKADVLNFYGKLNAIFTKILDLKILLTAGSFAKVKNLSFWWCFSDSFCWNITDDKAVALLIFLRLI